MADPRGFLNIEPQKPTPRPIHQRIKDYKELYQPMPAESVRAQASRCMDCGVPFCHTGCPLGNLIPDWNELVHRNRWHEALRALHDTNNFPEFTGKTCPAPCEASCVLALSGAAVTIKNIEAAIVDKGWEMGWIVPEPPDRETGKRVAIIGSGPAGLAAAQQLRRAGHAVTVFERDDRPGGLLTYGIPDFKMAKYYVERRIDQLEAEGVRFVLNAEVGRNVDPRELRERHDALLLTVGATRRARPRHPRPPPQGGRAGDALPDPAEPPRLRRPRSTATRSSPPARTSSSSAAATPRPTAWAPAIASRPARSSSSTTTPARPRTRTPRPPGPSGPRSSGSPPRTRRGASATGRSRPSSSSATSTATSRSCTPSASSSTSTRPASGSSRRSTAPSWSSRASWCSWPSASRAPSRPCPRRSGWR